MQETPIFLQNLQKAKNKLQIASHLAYVTYPLVQEKKLLLKIVSETKEGITEMINAVLKYEYFYQRINLSKNTHDNFQLFKNNVSKWYGITAEEISAINEIFDLMREHKSSAMEFARRDKVVIMSEDMKQKIITLEKVKQFLNLATNIISKIKKRWNIEMDNCVV